MARMGGKLNGRFRALGRHNSMFVRHALEGSFAPIPVVPPPGRLTRKRSFVRVVSTGAASITINAMN